MPLPAPYAPPWQRLGEDGVALLAWLGLKGRELWRRNRDGLLPLPTFWPRRWTRLFWPLVLLVVLLVAAGVGRAWLVHAGAAPVERATAGTAELDEAPPAEPLVGVEEDLPTDDLPASAVPADMERPSASRPERQGDGDSWLDAASEGDGEASGEGDPSRAEDAAPAPEIQGEAPAVSDPLAPLATPKPLEMPESPAEREARRLRAAWSTDPDAALLRDVTPDPANATLTLRLADPLPTLKADQRQRLADRWRDRAEEEGYRHLLLRDGSGRLWGRDALVGRGVILLDPPGPADEAP